RAHCRVVVVEHGQPAGVERAHDLGLGGGDGLPGAELPEVGGTDVEDDGDVRGRDLREVGDVPGAPGTHLHDEVPGLRGDAGDREGNTDLGVVGALGSDGRRIGCEHLAEEVLRGGLARGPGDADDGQVAGRVDDTTREGG